MSGQTDRPRPRLIARPRAVAISSLVPKDSIRALDWSSDGLWIVLGSDDGSLHVLRGSFDLSLERPPQAAYSSLLDPEVAQATGYWINRVGIIHPDSTPSGYHWIVTVTDHGRCYLHTVQSELDDTGQKISDSRAKVVERLNHQCRHADLQAAWAPDGSHFCLNGQGNEGRLVLWRHNPYSYGEYTHSEELKIPESLSHADGTAVPQLTELRWSPDGDWLAYLIHDEDNRPLARLQNIWTVRPNGKKCLKETVDLVQPGDDRWSCLGFSPTGQSLALGTVCGCLGWISLGDIGQKRFNPVIRFADRFTTGLYHGGPINCLDWSPDGRLIATGSEDRTVLLWDTVHGQSICRVGGFHEPIAALRFSPDGKFLVVDNNNDSALVGEKERLCPGLIELNVTPDEDPLYPHRIKPPWLP